MSTSNGSPFRDSCLRRSSLAGMKTSELLELLGATAAPRAPRSTEKAFRGLPHRLDGHLESMLQGQCSLNCLLHSSPPDVSGKGGVMALYPVCLPLRLCVPPAFLEKLGQWWCRCERGRSCCPTICCSMLGIKLVRTCVLCATAGGGGADLCSRFLRTSSHAI